MIENNPMHIKEVHDKIMKRMKEDNPMKNPKVVEKMVKTTNSRVIFPRIRQFISGHEINKFSFQICLC